MLALFKGMNFVDLANFFRLKSEDFRPHLLYDVRKALCSRDKPRKKGFEMGGVA